MTTQTQTGTVNLCRQTSQRLSHVVLLPNWREIEERSITDHLWHHPRITGGRVTHIAASFLHHSSSHQFAIMKHSSQQLKKKKKSPTAFSSCSADRQSCIYCELQCKYNSILFIHQCNTTLLTLPARLAYSVCLGLDACYSKTVSFMYEDRTEGASVCNTRERKANQRLLWAKQLNTG